MVSVCDGLVQGASPPPSPKALMRVEAKALPTGGSLSTASDAAPVAVESCEVTGDSFDSALVGKPERTRWGLVGGHPWATCVTIAPVHEHRGEPDDR
jgi:hypothetical protein